MSKWRPDKDWDKKLGDALANTKYGDARFIGTPIITHYERGLGEAGADAMLDALKKDGKSVINYSGDADPNIHRNGWLVFIPEE